MDFTSRVFIATTFILIDEKEKFGNYFQLLTFALPDTNQLLPRWRNW
jgi:hypothetical protein